MEYLKFAIYLLLWLLAIFGIAIPALLFFSNKKKLGTLSIIIYFLIVSFVLYTFHNTHPIKCYKEMHGVCYQDKEDYCSHHCREMLEDLTDTWRTNTNNQDSISKSIMKCYDHCLKTNEDLKK